MPDLVTSWSWSRYKAHKDCPAAFKYDSIDRLPRTMTSPAMDRGDAIHKKAEAYTKDETKLMPLELNRFEKQFKELKRLKPIVETGWSFRRDWSYTGRKEWFGPDVWLRVKTDVTVLYADATAEVIDHKTGRVYEDNADQVGLFALSGFMRYPQLKHITTRLWYLDTGDELIEEYDVAQVPMLKQVWERRIRPMFADRRFPPRPSWRCRNCSFSKGNGGPCQY